MTLEDSTTYQLILERGELRGGLRVTQRILLAQGRKRFGPPSVETEAAICGIVDQQRLERMAERILDAKGWDDLLATV